MAELKVVLVLNQNRRQRRTLSGLGAIDHRRLTLAIRSEVDRCTFATGFVDNQLAVEDVSGLKVDRITRLQRRRLNPLQTRPSRLGRPTILSILPGRRADVVLTLSPSSTTEQKQSTLQKNLTREPHSVWIAPEFP